MAIANDVETHAPSFSGSGFTETGKTFRVPTQPVDGKGEVVAFIGPGVEFKGEIFYEGSVQIDGTLDGEIHTDGVLLVGERAVIHARVNAGSVISKGKVNGNIIANKQVQLLSTAIMDGSLKTPELSMEIGVVFNGDISMNTGGEILEENPSPKFKDQFSTSKTYDYTHPMNKKDKDSNGASAADPVSSSVLPNKDKGSSGNSPQKSDGKIQQK